MYCNSHAVHGHCRLCTIELSVSQSMRKLYMSKQPTYHCSWLVNGEGRTGQQKNSRRNEWSSLTLQTHKAALCVWWGGTMREKLPGSSTECIVMGQSSSVSTMLHRSLSYLASSFVPSLQFSEMDLMQFWSFVQAPALNNTTVCQSTSEIDCYQK